MSTLKGSSPIVSSHMITSLIMTEGVYYYSIPCIANRSRWKKFCGFADRSVNATLFL